MQVAARRPPAAVRARSRRPARSWLGSLPRELAHGRVAPLLAAAWGPAGRPGPGDGMARPIEDCHMIEGMSEGASRHGGIDGGARRTRWRC